MKRGHAHKTHIRIQQLSEEVMDFDVTPATWQDVLTEGVTVATFTPTKSDEVIEGQKIESQSTHKFELRWQPGIRAEMRILVDDQLKDPTKDYDDTPDKRAFHIDSVINVKERNRDLILICSEIV